MKVKFNRVALAEALGLATSVVPSKTPKPILQCVKISAKDDVVKFSATDLEAGINLVVSQVEVIEPGDIVVSADKFNSIVRESIDDVISIETKDSTIHISSTDSQFTLYGHEPTQYPQVPEFDGNADIKVGLEALQEGIEYSLFAAAKESTRYAINGILWEIKGKKLTLVATDGRRLAKAVVNMTEATSDNVPESIIVPTKAMALLDRIAGSDKDVVELNLSGNKLVIRCGNAVLSASLVEGNFPPYEDIIPKDNDKVLILQTASALSAIKRASLLTTEDSKGVMLDVSKNNIEITCRAPETGDSEVELSVEYDGDGIKIGFNPQFLIDVLRVVKSDTVELRLGEPNRPGLIKSGSNFVYVIMPVNL